MLSPHSLKQKLANHLFNRQVSSVTRRFPPQLHAIAQRKLDMLNTAPTLDALRSPPSNHLEALKGDRLGQWSIRINSQWRICFTWDGQTFNDVEIVDYH
jgi:proteic killer suppression protein